LLVYHFKIGNLISFSIKLILITTPYLQPSQFASGSAEARTAHAFLGTGVLGLFAVHAGLGLQLGLSI
jgi:hypothetical protein